MQIVGEVQVAHGLTHAEHIGLPVLLFIYYPDWHDEIQVFVVVSNIDVLLFWLHDVQFVANNEHVVHGSVHN